MMFDIKTTKEKNIINIYVDGLFHVELSRGDEGLSVYVYSAKNGAQVTETWATDIETLSAEH